MSIGSRITSGTTLIKIVGGLLVVLGGIVGFTDQTVGSANCGSALGGGGEQLTLTGTAVCHQAMSSTVTLTWLLIIIGVVLLATAWIVDAIRRAGHRPATSGDTAHA